MNTDSISPQNQYLCVFPVSLNALRLFSIPPKFKYFVNSGVANVFILKQHSVGCKRNVDERGRREAKRFMKLPLKVNMGFKLHLWRCGDLCLISFRCWLAWVWAGKGGWIACGGAEWATHVHIYSHTSTRTHTSCSQPIFAVTVWTDASICTAASCLEKQSYLCAHLSNGFMWPSATPVWQHTACRGWAETNGKANIRLISKEGEECAGEVRGGEIDSRY